LRIINPNTVMSMNRSIVISLVLLAVATATTRASVVSTELSPNSLTSSQWRSADELFQEGVNYYGGLNGYPVDASKAVELFYQAAKKGHRDAQSILADMCLNGQGVKKNVEEAIVWYERLAEGDDATATNAQARLGKIYDKELNDKSKAARWYRKAADRGHQAARQWLRRNPDYDAQTEDLEELKKKKLTTND
jgi:TPR repeat protein